MKNRIMIAVACFCFFPFNSVATSNNDKSYENASGTLEVYDGVSSMNKHEKWSYSIIVPVGDRKNNEEIGGDGTLIYADSRRERRDMEEEGMTGYTGGMTSDDRPSSARDHRDREERGMTGYTGGMTSGDRPSSARDARDREDQGRTGYTGEE
ncbi:MAG: hypothetical protein SV686_10740 [Thermodesulfobacteriota bacterium]|nr:hypothetical protein [Thermodesulfobacteriota bacterium]